MTDKTPHAQRDFLLVAAAFFITMMGTTLPTPLYALYQQQLGFDAIWLTLIFSVYAAGVIAALVLVGSWSDQIGRRPLLLAGLLMAAISAVIFLTTHSVGGMLAGRLFSGFSAGIMTGTATVAVVESAPTAWRSQATLMATAANMFGLGFGPLLAGFTSQYLPWPTTLVFGLHLGLLVLAAAGIAVARETVQRPEQVRLGIMRPSITPAVRALFIPAAIAGLAGFSVAGVVTSLVPSIMRQLMGQQGGLVIGAVCCLFFVASIGGQAALKWIAPKQQMTVGCCGLIAGVLALGASIHTHQMGLLLLGGCLSGAGQGMVFKAGMGAVMAACPPQQKAAVTSALFIVFYFSMSLPVIALGFSIAPFGLSLAGEVFSVIIAAVAVLAMVSMGYARRASAA
ncbi:MAG: MFS transporter [Janthinobacterium lividum]